MIGKPVAASAILAPTSPEVSEVYGPPVDNSLTDWEFVRAVAFQHVHDGCSLMATASDGHRVLTLSCSAHGEMRIIRYEKGGDSIG